MISPLLANIYLHEVLDRWFEHDVTPRMQGAAFLVRYADDAVLVFADRRDAERVMDVLPKRLGKYGLTLHAEKTRLVPFGRPPKRPGERGDDGPRPGTFNFLGFTHYWGATRKGSWMVKRKTEAGRFRRAVRAVNLWCRYNLHAGVPAHHRMLSAILRGHCAYYGIAGNCFAIGAFRQRVQRIWRYWLARRSQKARMTLGTLRPPPPALPLATSSARPLAPTPPQRARDPEEPDAGNPHVRICGGPRRATSSVYPTQTC